MTLYKAKKLFTYAQLEYLETTSSGGNAYIKTGFTGGNPQTLFNAKLSFTTWVDGAGHGRGTKGTDNSIMVITTGGGSSNTHIKVGGFQYNFASPAYNEAKEVKIITNNYIWIDGVQKTVAGYNNTSLREIWLFKVNTDTSGWYDGWNKGRLYWCQLGNSEDDIQRNFIPAKRLSDSVLGLYDTVNDTFYTNSGSGSFSGGSIIGYF